MNRLGVYVCGLWLGLCAIAHAGSTDLPPARFESTQVQMGVPFKILLYAPDEIAANAAFDAAFAEVARLNRILSDYDPDSELSRLSRAAPTPAPVPLSDPLWIVLAHAQQLAGETDGAFDVTVGPYVRLWRRARRSKEMPSMDRLDQARAAVGYRYMQLDPARRTAQLTHANMRLDLGGIAMGYAVDEVLKLLRSRGMTRALVDASGDIGVGDPPPGKAGWIVGVIPLSDEGTPGRYVSLSNAAVTTSGDAFQHVDLGGKRYSHIVDPHTGLGLTDRVGVAIIADDCMTADALDTAVAVMGPRAGLDLVAKSPGVAALIVRPTDGEPEVFESPTFKKFVVPPPQP
jgi:thiamine biosynthesis lipoprotein